MPHKHKRDRGKGGNDQYELPPDKVAIALPARTSAAQDQAKAKNKKKRKKEADDTPREFARLMAWKQGVRPKSGLDDGAPRPKKRKRGQDQDDNKAEQSKKESSTGTDIPKILPGERMADFSARVDAALPLGGLVKKANGANVPGVKKLKTKTERKIEKMQKEWRATDARYKERLEDAREEAEEEEDPHQEILNATSRKKKKRKAGGAGDDDDPWAALAKARKEQEQTNAGLVGVHDVVQAPPTLKAPREKFKTRNGAVVDVANVPSASGSLKKREELNETRKGVIENYRSLMKDRRGDDQVDHSASTHVSRGIVNTR